MPKINVLPKEVYQLIAAGEVVERPSSVVKELIENAMDAGAQNITVEIKNGGTTYIRITDDGCGIEREEVRKVFISHATSKIKAQQDLDAIGTLGFRGEAMASISAVARVELLTRPAQASVGTRYEIAGGEEQSFDDAGCPCGTTIVVRDLFFNTPARMKFLKKDVSEGNAVAGILDAAAISHPEIAFRFIRDGKQVLVTNGQGDLKSAIYAVFGRERSESMIPVSYTYNGMQVSGYVSRPASSRKSRAMQYFFINGRMVKSKTAMAALEQAYKNSIMTGRFPACVLNIQMDAAFVDVNVHPAKTEVRFADEKPVFHLVYYGVKSAIETGDTVKEARLPGPPDAAARQTEPRANSVQEAAAFLKKPSRPVQTVFSQPQETHQAVAAPRSRYRLDIEYDEAQAPQTQTQAAPAGPDAAEAAQAVPEQAEPTQPPEASPVRVVEETEIPPAFTVIGEIFKTYILFEMENSLYLIDKHAAHERMNFEQLKSGAELYRQMLLSPVAVRLSKAEFSAVAENLQLLDGCGFEAEEFGTDTILVRAVPAMLEGADIADLICEVAQKLLEHKTDIEPEKMDWIFHSASCRAAVKAGDNTSPEEQRLFVKKLLSMPNIRYCPHGRPVMIKLSKYDIEKQFGRV